MAETVIPKLDDEKAAKIAQSDKWTAWSRVASVITPLILVPIGGFLALQTILNSQTMSAHTVTLDDMKADLKDVKGEVGPDHDAITILKTQMESVITFIWHRPPASGTKTPP